MGGIVWLYSNPNLTGITLPNSNQQFSNFRADLCPNLGYINFYPISGSSSNNIIINIQSNSWPASIVNHILYDLDQIGWTNGVLYIGGTNSAPDNSSGGYNGLAAISNLYPGKGWTLNHN